MTVLRDLNIPRMGSVENAKLVAWRIAEGESFAAGAVLCDVETDKTLTEVEAETMASLPDGSQPRATSSRSAT